jgi:hypothetical protein
MGKYVVKHGEMEICGKHGEICGKTWEICGKTWGNMC